MKLRNPFTSNSDQSKAARDFNKRGADLLLKLNVYPYGAGVEAPDPSADPDGYVDIVKTRPRVQVSADADTAKDVLDWQREALDNHLVARTFE